MMLCYSRGMETYEDDDGNERCDNCDELIGECSCTCCVCDDGLDECTCEEGPTL